MLEKAYHAKSKYTTKAQNNSISPANSQGWCDIWHFEKLAVDYRKVGRENFSVDATNNLFQLHKEGQQYIYQGQRHANDLRLAWMPRHIGLLLFAETERKGKKEIFSRMSHSAELALRPPSSISSEIKLSLIEVGVIWVLLHGSKSKS